MCMEELELSDVGSVHVECVCGGKRRTAVSRCKSRVTERSQAGVCNAMRTSRIHGVGVRFGNTIANVSGRTERTSTFSLHTPIFVAHPHVGQPQAIPNCDRRFTD